MSDSVVLDWYISLTDKDSISTCDVAYYGSNPSKGEAKTDDHKQMLSPFLPTSRTFLIKELWPDTEYRLKMVCSDSSGDIYASPTLKFTTGEQKRGCATFDVDIA